jgi:hypothetical protein
MQATRLFRLWAIREIGRGGLPQKTVARLESDDSARVAPTWLRR